MAAVVFSWELGDWAPASWLENELICEQAASMRPAPAMINVLKARALPAAPMLTAAAMSERSRTK
jgi:hypothetical protein